MEMTVLQNLQLHPATQRWNAPQQTTIVQTTDRQEQWDLS